MRLDQRLVDAAIEQMHKRFAQHEWAGAAAMYTRQGHVLTSIAVESPNEAAALCHETGAICEAHKFGYAITASVCVNRAPAATAISILTPCGICQERLFYWGPDVEVAVPDAQDATKWTVKTLSEVQPYYWYNVFIPHSTAQVQEPGP